MSLRGFGFFRSRIYFAAGIAAALGSGFFRLFSGLCTASAADLGARRRRPHQRLNDLPVVPADSNGAMCRLAGMPAVRRKAPVTLLLRGLHDRKNLSGLVAAFACARSFRLFFDLASFQLTAALMGCLSDFIPIALLAFARDERGLRRTLRRKEYGRWRCSPSSPLLWGGVGVGVRVDCWKCIGLVRDYPHPGALGAPDPPHKGEERRKFPSPAAIA